VQKQNKKFEKKVSTTMNEINFGPKQLTIKDAFDPDDTATIHITTNSWINDKTANVSITPLNCNRISFDFKSKDYQQQQANKKGWNGLKHFVPIKKKDSIFMNHIANSKNNNNNSQSNSNKPAMITLSSSNLTQSSSSYQNVYKSNNYLENIGIQLNQLNVKGKTVSFFFFF
jgi:hypothetical protein